MEHAGKRDGSDPTHPRCAKPATPMSVEADAIAISTWAYRARFVTDDLLPSPYFAASPPALNHETVGQRSEALQIACRCRRTRQLSPLRADDNRACRARSERLRATPVALARCSQDRSRHRTRRHAH